MNRALSVMIPLSDATGMIKTAFREHTARLLKHNSAYLAGLKDSLDFNCAPYLDQVLAEVFADAGIPEVVGGTSNSTHMLVDAGLPRDLAAPLAVSVYYVVLAQLTAFFPDLVLGRNCGYQYGMCSEFDALITPPPQWHERM